MDFAKIVKHILIDKGMTQAQLADIMGLSKQTLNKMLLKKDHRINGDITVISNLLGYDVLLQFRDRQTGKVISAD